MVALAAAGMPARAAFPLLFEAARNGAFTAFAHGLYLSCKARSHPTFMA